MKNSEQLVPDEIILNKIYLIRDKKVMLDMDLSELYGVETKQLKRQVKRNLIRFPDDFMFELTSNEFENLRCQIGTSSWGGVRYLPMAFTEQGVAMISSVLSSEKAILVNIHIIRIFTKLRAFLFENKDVLLKIKDLETITSKHDGEIKSIINALNQLFQQKKVPREKIGFKSTKEI